MPNTTPTSTRDVPRHLRPSDGRRTAGTGHLYLIQFDNGTLKAGCTSDLPTRFIKHTRDSGRYGLRIVNHWSSQRFCDIRLRERQLLDILAHIGTRTAAGREFFRDIPFSIARYQAENLDRARSERCCCGHCVTPLDVRLPVHIRGIKQTGTERTVFDVQLPCGAVVTALLGDDDYGMNGQYPLRSGDHITVELSPGATTLMFGYVLEEPDRMRRKPQSGPR
ncbi:hypothetical protein A5768_26375 [Mycolicibacterium fortuitum]|uniref:hypothetical protein n=1 Tax=Mycolicibacterium fortuitum TaxID=1766 RepID=UPI0007E9B1F8|nr:hypothetical protein [Mycolicibacterium fortuitum]OBG21630.1 hypothetical protein A5768_26375 [Mycolicibacterium fortuitum]